MGKKFSFDPLIRLCWILYIVFLFNNINYAYNLGVIKDSQIMDLFLYLNIGKYFVAISPVSAILMMTFIYSISLLEFKDVKIFEDEIRTRILRKRLIPYKIIIFMTLSISSYIIYFSKDRGLIYSSITLVIISVFIHYLKSCYFKSYIFDRKRQWIENCEYEKENTKDILVDTKLWRYKIWFSSFKKVKFKTRIILIIETIPITIILLILFIYINNIIARIYFVYYLIIHIMIYIDCIFGLFTSLDGKCSGVLTSRKNKDINYQICVTDYSNKRELMLSTYHNCEVEEMDNIRVVHGILSKKSISINDICINRIPSGNIAMYVLVFIILALIIGDKNSIDKVYEDINYQNYIDDEEAKEERTEIEDKSYKKNIDINKTQIYDDYNGEVNGYVAVTVDKLYLNKKSSKLILKIKNNTDRGLVLNGLDQIKIYDKDNLSHSNILLPDNEYTCEVDIEDMYNENKVSNLVINLEYTLSETIIFDQESGDYSGLYHYDLNVIDNHFVIDVDINKEDADIEFEEYSQFYNVSDKIVEFK